MQTPNDKGIVCPVCEGENQKVINSRPRNGRLYRRRVCLDCNYRFTTYEMDPTYLFDTLEKHLDEQTMRKIAVIIDAEFPVHDERGRPSKWRQKLLQSDGY